MRLTRQKSIKEVRPQRIEAIALHLFPVSDVHIAARFVFRKLRLFNLTFAESVCSHAECEGISGEFYDKFNVVCANVSNVSYYCEVNHCNSHIKQLVHAHYANLDQQVDLPPCDLYKLNKQTYIE